MFIASTKSFKVRNASGETFLIPMGFVGELPDKFADNWLVQAAIKDGSIKAPASKKDKDVDAAILESKAEALEAQKAKEEAKAEDKKASKKK